MGNGSYRGSLNYFVCLVEMVLPPNANVYYAINTSCDLNFILRPKGDSTSLSSAHSSPGSASIGPIVTGGGSTPGRPRLRESSGTKDALKARKKILSLGL